MKSNTIGFVLFMLTFSFVPGLAQDSWTLQRAVLTALRQNNTLAQQRLEVEKADQQVKEAWGSALPKLDLAGSYQNALKKPVFFLPGAFFGGSGVVPVEIGSTHSLSGSLTASQILFNSAVFVGIGASSIYSKAARRMYEAKVVETVTGVKKAFYQALFAREVKRMMEETMKNAEENFRNVEVMGKQGIMSEYDLLRATVQVENLRPQLLQAENNYQLSLDNLRAMIGDVPAEDFAIADSLKFIPLADSLLVDSEKKVLSENHTIQALKLQADVARAFVWAERSAYFPTIAAFGNYQYQGQKNTFNFGSSDFIASSTIGLSISLNLFDGLRTNARVEQRKIEVLKTEESVVEIQRKLVIAAQVAVNQLKQAEKRYKVQERSVQTAQRGYHLVTLRFKAGSASQLEVNDAQLALTQSQVNRAQALYDYLVASADLQNVLGVVPDYAKRFTVTD